MSFRRSFFFSLPQTLALSLLLTGCARVDYGAARRQEKNGFYEEALKSYLRLAERRPASALAPEALYRAGCVAGRILGDQDLAREALQRLMDRYGDQQQWGPRAERLLFNTPNYFPLTENAQWTEGDSETGGRNARVRVVCRPDEKDKGAALFTRSYYAGERFVKELSTQNIYRKAGGELRERAAGQDADGVVLKVPFEKGYHWASRRGGRPFVFTVEGTADVQVKAGFFKKCLKVSERPEGAEGSWKMDYYAPGVGKVLTTLGTPSGERRNTELLSYDLGSGQEIGD